MPWRRFAPNIHESAEVRENGVGNRHLGQAEVHVLGLPGGWRFLPKPGPDHPPNRGQGLVTECKRRSHVVLFVFPPLTESLLRPFIVQRTKIPKPASCALHLAAASAGL
jgi:hypothetical protein